MVRLGHGEGLVCPRGVVGRSFSGAELTDGAHSVSGAGQGGREREPIWPLAADDDRKEQGRIERAGEVVQTWRKVSLSKS